MYKDCNLKALYPSLQLLSKGTAPTPFLIEKGESRGSLEQDSRAVTEFSVNDMSSHLEDTF